jgi:hypothetical protein
MHYLCLGYYDPKAFEDLSESERKALGAECAPYDQEFRDSGRVVSLASLEHGTHVVLQPDDPQTSVTDGPFAESKELVGSFFIVEAEDLDAAVRIASLHPAARIRADLGFAIEVRPIEILGMRSSETGELELVQGSVPHEPDADG